MKLVSVLPQGAQGDSTLPITAAMDEAAIWPWYMWTWFFWLA